MLPTHVVLVPVKAGADIKSRLGVDPAQLERTELMHAFVADSIAAVRHSELVHEVIVVSSEFVDLGQSGWLPDHGGGLNRALAVAAGEVQHQHPKCTVVAMLGDLPCLTTSDVDLVLADGQHSERWFLADHQGTGTTMLAAAPGQELQPHFGADSARRHAASGAVPCTLDVPTARLDIDTTADLDIAIDIGVGTHTRAVLTRTRTH